MKKLLCTVLIFSFVLSATAQQTNSYPFQKQALPSMIPNNVPVSVTSSLETNNDYTNVKWCFSYKGCMVSYLYDGKENHILYDNDGNQTVTEVMAEPGSFPTGVSAYWIRNYSGRRMGPVFKVTHADSNTSYVLLNGNNRLAFDDHGNYYIPAPEVSR